MESPGNLIANMVSWYLLVDFNEKWNFFCFAVQIEKTVMYILQKEWEKKLFYSSR